MKKKTLRFLSVVMSAVTAFTFAGVAAPATISAADASVAINATNFPDENFRNALSTYLDRDSNGSLSASEIACLTSLYVDYSPYYSYNTNSYSYSSDSYGTYGYMYLYDVQDVTGIENFTSLTYIMLNSVTNTSIDFTKMADLNDLSIIYSGQLTSIDVTGLSNLGYLSVTNCGAFKSLDVSTNTNLYSVTCAGNDLFTTFKNSANNKNLSSVYVYGPSVKSLDLSKLSALTDVALCDCDLSLDKVGIKNKNKITSIAIRNNKKSGLVPSQYKNLGYLEYESAGLTSIDLSKNKKLYSVSLKDNSLKSVNVSMLKKLWYLDVSYNKLSKIDISKNKKLSNLNVCNNGISKLDLSKNKNIFSVEAMSNPLITKLDFSKCKSLYSFSADKDVKITLPKDKYTASYYDYAKDKYVDKKIKNNTFTADSLGLAGTYNVYINGKKHWLSADFNW